jgi:hypothetical protein
MRLTLSFVASLLACGCTPDGKAAEPASAPVTSRSPAPAALPALPGTPKAAAPTPAVPGEPEEADPRIRAIRERYQAIEGALTAEPTRKLERTCKGEIALSAQLFERDGLQKAVVRFHPPGDTSDIYNLYFEHGQPVFVLYSELGFEGGGTTLIEQRFYIADGKPVRCLSKHAVNAAGEDLSELEIAERIQRVANTEGDCKRAKRALALAGALTGEKDAEATLTRLCAL